METFKGVLIKEEACAEENNYVACKSPEGLNTSGRNAAEKLRKCKVVSGWLLAAEFKIINSETEVGGKLFYLPKHLQVLTSSLTLALAPQVWSLGFPAQLKKIFFFKHNSSLSLQRQPPSIQLHARSHTCTHALTSAQLVFD